MASFINMYKWCDSVLISSLRKSRLRLLSILQRKYYRGRRRCAMHIDYELFHKSRRALFFLLAPKSLTCLTLAAHQEYRTNPSDPGRISCLINQSAAGCTAKGCLRRTLLQGSP